MRTKEELSNDTANVSTGLHETFQVSGKTLSTVKAIVEEREKRLW